MKGVNAIMTIDIFQAIRRLDDNVNSLIDSLPDINIKDEDKQSLLHEAIAFNNIEAGIKLIDKGIDVNSQDNKGQTPLHYAAAHKNTVIARKILENGGDISLVDKFGNSPLWTAVFNARGNYDLVKVFAEFECSRIRDKKNNNGKSPLDFAKQINDSELVSIIS